MKSSALLLATLALTGLPLTACGDGEPSVDASSTASSTATATASSTPSTPGSAGSATTTVAAWCTEILGFSTEAAALGEDPSDREVVDFANEFGTKMLQMGAPADMTEKARTQWVGSMETFRDVTVDDIAGDKNPLDGFETAELDEYLNTACADTATALSSPSAGS